MTAAGAIGAFAILVHALDGEAVAFYEKFGFEPPGCDENNLVHSERFQVDKVPI